MELPKNLVQMGKPDKSHKIFIEDYIMSYIKEWNRTCEGQSTGLAFYGKSCKEDGCTYYFLYGASRIEGLTGKGSYLSQLDREEIASIGKRHFPEYDFLVWSTVREELPEILYVDTRGKGIAVSGYACFYEKNESMLSFMLEMEENDKRSDTYVRGTWDTGSIREEKKEADALAPANEEKAKKPDRGRQMAKYLQRMKIAAAAMFVVLCVIGITTVNDFDKMEELQVAAGQVIAELSHQKIPDATESDSPETLENNSHIVQIQETGGTALPDNDGKTVSSAGTEKAETLESLENLADVSANTDTAVQGPAVTSDMPEDPAYYTIMRGDTLNAICRRKYGNLEMVKKVCELNGIKNPDDIEVGQTILLP